MSTLKTINVTHPTSATNNITLDSSGNVGIGTSSPGSIAKLTVSNTSTADNNRMGVVGSTYLSTPSYTATFISQGDTATTGTQCGLSSVNLGALYFQNTSAGLIYTNGGAPIVFGTANVERMRIDSSGNVGIGTTSPTALLTVAGTASFTGNTTLGSYSETVVAIGTVTTANTLSLATGTVQTATLTASTACTFTMPTATAGKSFILLLKQAASTGNGTATFTGVKWNSAGAPTITATAGKMDILTFVADGTNWYGSYSQGYTP